MLLKLLVLMLTADILSHPIVISNNPLINALQSSFVTPNNDNGIYIVLMKLKKLY